MFKIEELAAYLQDNFNVPAIAAFDMAEGLVIFINERLKTEWAEVADVRQYLRDIVIEVASD